MLTSEEYVAKGGVRCPFCESHGLTGLGFDVTSGLATQEIVCIECGASWRDIYVLDHFEVIKE